MTDRVQSLTVVLDDDYRVDDVEFIVNAIRMIKGVRTVENGPVVDHADWMARMRVGTDLQNEVLEMFRNKLK